MLKVKTYIDVSTIPNAGLGCFADEDIKKGDLIWELNPILDRIYTDDNLKTMTERDVEFVKIYSYKENGLYFLCIDNSRFFNHSIDYCNTFDPNNTHKTYALKDIKKGEEILSNYNTFGVTTDDKTFNIDI